MKVVESAVHDRNKVLKAYKESCKDYRVSQKKLQHVWQAVTTYRGRKEGRFGPGHQIIDSKCKTAQHITSTFGDCYFLSIRHISTEFRKIVSPGGLLQLFIFKWDVSKNWSYELFSFAWKLRKYIGKYNLELGKMFSWIKSDLFLEFWSILESKYRIAMTRSLWERVTLWRHISKSRN